MQRLKLLYVVAGLLLAGYWSERLIAVHLTEGIPISSGTIFCLALFVSVPAFGYVVLFKLFPLAGRFLRH
jgi:hypothetical protein